MIEYDGLTKSALRNELEELTEAFVKSGGRIRCVPFDPDKIPIDVAAAGKGLKVQTCPHCGSTGRGGFFNRWHGDNCRSKSKPAPKEVKVRKPRSDKGGPRKHK